MTDAVVGSERGAVWALLVTLAILVAALGLLPFAVYSLAPWLGGQWNPRAHYGVALAIQALISATVLAIAGRSVFGQSRGAWDVFVVTAMAVGALAVVVFTVAVFCAFIDAGLTAPKFTKYGGFWLAMVALVVGAPIAEELLFRGFLFPALAPSLGPIYAAIISSVLWTSIHAPFTGHLPIPGGAYGIFVLMGLVLAWARLRSGSLLPCIFAHAIFGFLPALREALTQ